MPVQKLISTSVSLFLLENNGFIAWRLGLNLGFERKAYRPRPIRGMYCVTCFNDVYKFSSEDNKPLYKSSTCAEMKSGDMQTLV